MTLMPPTSGKQTSGKGWLFVGKYMSVIVTSWAFYLFYFLGYGIIEITFIPVFLKLCYGTFSIILLE